MAEYESPFKAISLDAGAVLRRPAGQGGRYQRVLPVHVWRLEPEGR